MLATLRQWGRRFAPARILNAFRKSQAADWLWSDRYLVIYRSDRAESEKMAAPSTRIRPNSLEDLETFDQTETWLSRDQFLADAEKRMADGEVVFTATENGKLIYYTWMVPEQEDNYFPFVDQPYRFPPGSVVSYNSYTHPDARGRGLHTAGMRAMIKWALAQPHINYVYGAVDIDNTASRHCSQKIGRRPYEVLYRKRRFGRTTKGRLPASFASDYDEKRGRKLG